MRRTTVFLDEALERRLKQRARREGKSFAQCVREAVAQYLAGRPGTRRGLPPFFGIAAGADRDLSERVDEYLWPDPHA
jgi:hypothetical protein